MKFCEVFFFIFFLILDAFGNGEDSSLPQSTFWKGQSIVSRPWFGLGVSPESKVTAHEIVRKGVGRRVVQIVGLTRAARNRMVNLTNSKVLLDLGGGGQS